MCVEFIAVNFGAKVKIPFETNHTFLFFFVKCTASNPYFCLKRLFMRISIENISKSFGEKQALSGVSFSLAEGSVTGFLGPNGAGKSTLMKILTTTLRADSGKAFVNGYDISKNPMEVKRSVGYLAENNPLYESMYVKEYLAFCTNVYGVSKQNIDRVIEQTGLSEAFKQKIGELSKGYRQRVGLAAALIHDPAVLILDEPTTGLDPNQLTGIRNLIRELGKEKTVLFSTHIMQEVEAVCGHVILINKGEIIAHQPIDELDHHKEQLIFVEFDYRVEDVLLQKLPHVQSVANTDGLAWELTFDTQKDMRPAVFDFAHDNGLKIVQLRHKNKNLEALFKEMTH